MKRWLFRNAAVWAAGITLLLPLAPITAQDPPKKQDAAKTDDKKDPDDEVKSSPKEEWAAIQSKYQKLVADFREAITKAEAKDRPKIQKERMELFKPLAKRAMDLAEKHIDSPEALNAISFARNFARDAESEKRANSLMEKLASKISLESLSESQLKAPNPMFSSAGVRVFEQLKAKPDHPKVEEVLAWIAMVTAYGGSPKTSETYNATIEWFADKFPSSKQLERLIPLLAQDDNPPWAAKQLRKIVAANKEGKLNLYSSYALGSMLAKEDATTKEGIAILEKFLEAAKEEKKDRTLAGFISEAEEAVENVKALGQPVKEIDGEDLDGKKFKLSDYKGKVVLLDFWGFW